MNIWQTLEKPFFVLAPMDDVTDTVFRQLVAQWAAPDVFVTEFASADGLQSSGRSAVMKKLAVSPNESTPLIAQIWGLQPDNYRQTAQEIVEMGVFAGLDINMGCPVPKVVKNGACSALIENRPLAKQLIDAARDGLGSSLPLSVKTRVGFKSIDLTWLEFLLQQNIDALTVHTRTTKEQSKVPAHHDLWPEIVALRDAIAPQTVLIANGDIANHAHGQVLASSARVEGLMIGRGIFHDPYAFSEASPWKDESREHKIDMYRQHIDLWNQTWPEANPNALKKFCKVYINGFDGASELRQDLMQASNATELLIVLEKSL